MRCFFLSGGHIVAAEDLGGLSEDEAVALARQLFSQREAHIEGFEVWDGTRIIYKHPDPDAERPSTSS